MVKLTCGKNQSAKALRREFALKYKKRKEKKADLSSVLELRSGGLTVRDRISVIFFLIS